MAGSPGVSDLCAETPSNCFLDCPGLIAEWYLRLASAADGVLLITTNEATSIHAARQSIERLEHYGCEMDKIRLVVNRFEQQNGVAIKAIEAALGKDVYHVLPSDREAMHNAFLGHQPVGSDSRLGRSMDEMWNRLMRKSAPVKAQRSGVRFSRLPSDKRAASNPRTADLISCGSDSTAGHEICAKVPADHCTHPAE